MTINSPNSHLISLERLNTDTILNEDNSLTTMDPFLESFREVLVDYSNFTSKSALWVLAHSTKHVLTNTAIKYIPQFLLDKVLTKQQINSSKIKKAQYCFIQIIYLMIALNIVTTRFLSKLLNVINEPNIRLSLKYQYINMGIAKVINDSQQTVASYNVKRLKSYYYALVRSFPVQDAPHRFYVINAKHDSSYAFHKLEKIPDKSNSDLSMRPVSVKNNDIISGPYKSYRIVFKGKGEIATPKKTDRLKQFIMTYFAGAVILLTAFGMGLVTVGLNISAGIFNSLLIIGMPTIIINLVLFNTAVLSLLKDILSGNLLRDNEGEYIKSSIPLFIISLCGGITYCAMTFITSKAVFDALVLSMPAIAPVATAFIIPLAIIFAASTGISFCALFFSSMIDVVRDGIVEQLVLFVRDFTQHLVKKDMLINFLKLSLKIMKFFVALLAAIYLTVVETALLYSMSIAVLVNPTLALLLTIIAAPANMLFTYKMYNSFVNMVINMPVTLYGFWEHCHMIKNNPIAFYETAKWLLSFAGFFVINVLNARGNGTGLADELQNDECQAFLKSVGINPRETAVVIATKAIDMSDVYATNYSEGFDPAFGYIDGNLNLDQNDIGTGRLSPLSPISILKTGSQSPLSVYNCSESTQLPLLNNHNIKDRNQVQEESLPLEFNSTVPAYTKLNLH